jgi:hypothetical protein
MWIPVVSGSRADSHPGAFDSAVARRAGLVILTG